MILRKVLKILNFIYISKILIKKYFNLLIKLKKYFIILNKVFLLLKNTKNNIKKLVIIYNNN